MQPRNDFEQAALLKDYRRSIRRFVKDKWGLAPQPVKPEYEKDWQLVIDSTGPAWEVAKRRVRPDWFGDYDETRGEWLWYDFRKGSHFSWQQHLILLGVEKAIRGKAPRKLSTVSGHGIGKSATCAWIVLWFLYCFAESQVPVTAPTSAQMHDVLWKELMIWIQRMNEDDRELFEWQSDYVRVNFSPESWFARARTSTKENTEAIAGVHAEHVAIVIDEASGIPEQVFMTAQGALTSGNVLLVMISNGTRTIGYFYDSHHTDKSDFQTFTFSSEESPLVDKQYVRDMAKKYGTESEEYKIRVKGGFPGEDMMDDSGYLQLIPYSKISVRASGVLDSFLGRTILGIDPAGEGKDKATFVVRDRFKAKLVHEIATSNDREIAEAALTLATEFHVKPEDIVVGAFGTGSDVGKEIALATKDEKEPWNIYTVMEGNAPEKEEVYNPQFFARNSDELTNPEGRPKDFVDMYLNLRALMYFRARKWLFAGGQVVDESVDNSPFAGELSVIRYKRSLQGNRIQLMSKREMLKLRIPSPNIADAFALTFLRTMDDDQKKFDEKQEAENEREERVTGDERFSSV